MVVFGWGANSWFKPTVYFLGAQISSINGRARASCSCKLLLARATAVYYWPFLAAGRRAIPALCCLQISGHDQKEAQVAPQYTGMKIQLWEEVTMRTQELNQKCLIGP
eukprot:1014725-Pelagomonas_calceolata.AAC.7